MFTYQILIKESTSLPPDFSKKIPLIMEFCENQNSSHFNQMEEVETLLSVIREDILFNDMF